MNSLETLTISRTLNTCRKCGWQWFSRKEKMPRSCPKCKSSLWNREAKQRGHPLGYRGQNSLYIIAMRKGNPCATLQQISDKVGVSREFVRQALLRDQLPTRHYVEHRLYECLNCGKQTVNKHFCSRQCQYEYCHPQVECDYCHKLFRRHQSQLARTTQQRVHFFCSRICQGKWLAQNYGFALHPENAKPNKKYNYDQITLQTHQLRDKGYTYDAIAKELHMPSVSLWNILRQTEGTIPRTMALVPHHRSNQQHPRTPQQHIRARWLKHLNFMDKEIIGMLRCSASTISRSLR